MICNRCQADIPEFCKFCIKCGNRIVRETDAAAAPQQSEQTQPAQQQQNTQQQSSSPFGEKHISGRHFSLEDIARQVAESSNEIGLASAPQSEQTQPAQQQQNTQQQSSSPFGEKHISGRHFSLEDIARQVAESSNEIGLASAPPDRPRRKKRRPPQQSSFLPPIGSGDDMDLSELNTSAAQPSQPAQQQNNPLLPSMEELQKKSQRSASERPAAVRLTKHTDRSAGNASSTAVPSAPAVPAAAHSAPPAAPAVSAAPAEQPRKASAAYQYTISAVPVPTGLQIQSALPLFSGDIRQQVSELKQSYDAKKQAAERR